VRLQRLLVNFVLTFGMAFCTVQAQSDTPAVFGGVLCMTIVGTFLLWASA